MLEINLCLIAADSALAIGLIPLRSRSNAAGRVAQVKADSVQEDIEAGFRRIVGIAAVSGGAAENTLGANAEITALLKVAEGSASRRAANRNAKSRRGIILVLGEVRLPGRNAGDWSKSNNVWPWATSFACPKRGDAPVSRRKVARRAACDAS